MNEELRIFSSCSRVCGFSLYSSVIFTIRSASYRTLKFMVSSSRGEWWCPIISQTSSINSCGALSVLRISSATGGPSICWYLADEESYFSSAFLIPISWRRAEALITIISLPSSPFPMTSACSATSSACWILRESIPKYLRMAMAIRSLNRSPCLATSSGGMAPRHCSAWGQ